MEMRVTERLGSRYSIIQGGMQRVGFAEVASAVSNADGQGVLATLEQPTPDDLRKEIIRCRTITPPSCAEYVQAIVGSGEPRRPYTRTRLFHAP